MEKKGGSDADRQPVDRRDQRLFERGDLAHEPPGGKITQASRGEAKKIADVVAGGEDAALAAQHERANVRVALGRFERLGQRFVHSPGDRVILLGPGEGRRQDRAFAGDFDVAHALIPGIAWRGLSDQAAALPISAPQYLHLVAAGFRSSERHWGQVLVGSGAPNTVLPVRAMMYLLGATIRKYTTAIK